MRRTKLFLTLLCCFSLLGARAPAQDPDDDPKNGTFVDCHGETVVLFGHSGSRDGRYAVGWTIRARAASAKPVDWATYKKDDPFTWFGEYALPGDPYDPGAYSFVNGVVDLREGKFTVLATDTPYFPHANHQDLQVTWSDNGPGVRYGLVVNDGRWNTANLWLVSFDTTGTRVLDLRKAADKVVQAAIDKKASRNHRTYVTSYRADRTNDGSDTVVNPFKGKTLHIPFESEVPKSGEVPTYSGEVIVGLPKGDVRGVANVKAE